MKSRCGGKTSLEWVKKISLMCSFQQKNRFAYECTMFLWASARLAIPSATFSSAMACGLKDWPPNVMFLNLDNETRKSEIVAP